MHKLKTEAIILKTQSFRERDQILTLFSLENGIIHCIFKKGRNSSLNRLSSLNPLTRAEFILSGRNQNFMACDEIDITSYYLEIRKGLEMLDAACQMLKAVGKTQFSGKPAPLLYALLVKYLEVLPKSPFPDTLIGSFLLKLLRHEGSLGHLGFCSICGISTVGLFLSGGESFCKPHANPDALFFNVDEMAAMQVLLYSQKMGEITPLELSPSLREKLYLFFDMQLSH